MGKATMRQQNIHERHRLSLKLSTDLVHPEVDTNTFLVRSSDGKYDYEVSILADQCTDKSCFLKCTYCDVCSHTYRCVCPDSLVNNNMCKHIHLVRRKQLEESGANVDNEAFQGHTVQHDISYVEEELSTIVKSVTTGRPNEPQKLQEEIKDICERIVSTVGDSFDLDALKQLRSQLNAAMSTFTSFSRQDSYSNIRPLSKMPANKNIEKQRKFYSIKKKRKKDLTVRFAKPTRAEKASFEREPEWLPIFVSREHPVHATQFESCKVKEMKDTTHKELAAKGRIGNIIK